jgi:tRNA threonylcarbamoyladenosine biosynthesis protein TsaB
MRLLALDTSSLQASVALTDDERVLAERERVVTTHSESLLVLVDECLRAAGLTVADVDVIACGAGPGSFTGLRIGLATAKGLCYAAKKPLVMVSSLAALALRLPDDAPCVCAVDAFKHEVYAARFDVQKGHPQLVGAERVLPPAELATELATLAPITLLGNAVQKYPELLVPGVRPVEALPSALAVAILARRRALAGELDDVATAAPRYIRPSEAELVKAGRQR